MKYSIPIFLISLMSATLFAEVVVYEGFDMQSMKRPIGGAESNAGQSSKGWLSKA